MTKMNSHTPDDSSPIHFEMNSILTPLIQVLEILMDNVYLEPVVRAEIDHKINIIKSRLETIEEAVDLHPIG
jgi:hypothetical protein